MKYSWKNNKDRNRHKKRIKRSGQARLVSVKDITGNIPTTWRWSRQDRTNTNWLINYWPIDCTTNASSMSKSRTCLTQVRLTDADPHLRSVRRAFRKPSAARQQAIKRLTATHVRRQNVTFALPIVATFVVTPKLGDIDVHISVDDGLSFRNVYRSIFDNLSGLWPSNDWPDLLWLGTEAC